MTQETEAPEGRDVGRAVLWRGLDGRGTEYCRLRRMGAGWALGGTVTLAFGDAPAVVRYAVACDDTWQTRTVVVDATIRRERWELRLAADGGHWTVDGQPRPDLDGCVDVDLGVTPGTNTLPIRRLNLAVGESREVVAAWVRFPALDMRPLAQRYTRLDEHTYHYESDTGFSAELTVDGLGLIVSYPQGWERVAAT
ncbi:MAG TPA: putative glycolipid-binding domain-containing protein [Ktedonobacterales bacterium]|nr:putative glycolipid-binding domain-containing protein [Ktedonobacterales bacterium]